MLVLPGQVLELRAREQTSGRRSRHCSTSAQDGPPHHRRRRHKRSPGRRPARRPAPGPSRRSRPPDGTVIDGPFHAGRESLVTPVSRCRSPRPPATPSSAAPSATGAAADDEAERRHGRHHAGPDRGHGLSSATFPRTYQDGRQGRPASSSCPSSSSSPSSRSSWGLVGPDPKLAHALVVAVAGADHRLPLRTRTGPHPSIKVGVGRGASLGVLIKNARNADGWRRSTPRRRQDRHPHRRRATVTDIVATGSRPRTTCPTLPGG